MTAPPFPSQKAIERSAILGFALGTVALTATFGLRTAFQQPDFYADSVQFSTLAVHGISELTVALLVAFVALLFRREGLAKAWLAVISVILVIVKTLFLMVLFTLNEREPWAMSPGTVLLCGVVTLPITLSFFPVVTAIFAARGTVSPQTSGLPRGTLPDSPTAYDRPLEARAALSIWLASTGLGATALGPDTLVRAWGLLVLGAAALHFVIGRIQERRLAEWVKHALTSGASDYFVRDEPPPEELPSIHEGDARKATLFAAADEPGSYRKGPAKIPIAAVDPGVSPSRSFRARVTSRMIAPLVYTPLAIAFSWPLLHSSDLPPQAISSAFEHYKVSPYSGTPIPGINAPDHTGNPHLTLWTVERGENSTHLVAHDPDTHQLVQEDALFRRVRGVSKTRLAELANAIVYNGDCCVLQGADPGWTKDTTGTQPKAPYVENGKIIYWRGWNGATYRYEVPIDPGMIEATGNN